MGAHQELPALRILRWTRRVLVLAVALLAVYVMVRWRLAQVPDGTDDMRPHMRSGSWYLYDRTVSVPARFRVKDMVVYESVHPKTRIRTRRISRVEGLPGDTVTRTRIELEESDLGESDACSPFRHRVPEAHIFVRSPNHFSASAVEEDVPRERILGRIVVVF